MLARAAQPDLMAHPRAAQSTQANGLILLRTSTLLPDSGAMRVPARRQLQNRSEAKRSDPGLGGPDGFAGGGRGREPSPGTDRCERQTSRWMCQPKPSSEQMDQSPDCSGSRRRDPRRRAPTNRSNRTARRAGASSGDVIGVDQRAERVVEEQRGLPRPDERRRLGGGLRYRIVGGLHYVVAELHRLVRRDDAFFAVGGRPFGGLLGRALAQGPPGTCGRERRAARGSFAGSGYRWYEGGHVRYRAGAGRPVRDGSAQRCGRAQRVCRHCRRTDGCRLGGPPRVDASAESTRYRHALGALAGFGLLALTNAIAIVVSVRWPVGGFVIRIGHLAFDAAETIALGAVVAAGMALWTRFVRLHASAGLAVYTLLATPCHVPRARVRPLSPSLRRARRPPDRPDLLRADPSLGVRRPCRLRGRDTSLSLALCAPRHVRRGVGWHPDEPPHLP